MGVYLTSDISRCLGAILCSADPPLLLPTVLSLPSLKTDHAERVNPYCRNNDRHTLAKPFKRPLKPNGLFFVLFLSQRVNFCSGTDDLPASDFVRCT